MLRRAVLLTIAFMAIAAPAQAGVVKITRNAFIGTGDDPRPLFSERRDGETNRLTVSFKRGRGYTFVDTRTPLKAGRGCRQRTRHRVTCPRTPWQPDVDLGGGADRLKIRTWFDTLDAGPGNDVVDARKLGTLRGLPGLNSLNGVGDIQGGDGDDVLYAGRLRSRLGDLLIGMDGGLGNDKLIGGPADDVLHDNDSFEHAPGTIAEGDDDDILRGGAGDDFVIASEGDDRLSGGRGDDWIRAGIGDDTLTGDSGNDLLDGAEGSDAVAGSEGRDTAFNWYRDSTRGVPPSIPPVSVTFDGQPNDGPPGDNDNYAPDTERSISQIEGDLKEPHGQNGVWETEGRFGEDVDARVDLFSANGTADSPGVGAFQGLYGLTASPAALALVRLAGTADEDCSRQLVSDLSIRPSVFQRPIDGQVEPAGATPPFIVSGAASNAQPLEDSRFVTRDNCEGTVTHVDKGNVRVTSLSTGESVTVPAGQEIFFRRGNR